MPNRDGTGPLGNGPFTGRRGNFAGRGQRAVGIRGAQNLAGKGLGGSDECTCPKCGYKEPHTRGIPCTEKMCPKCKTPMNGVYCA